MRENTAKYHPHLLPVTIILMAALVFLPSLRNGLVGWDDRIITDNPITQELSAGSIFRTFFPSQGIGVSYQPLRAFSFSVLYALAGDNPAAYLWFNFLLYLANIFLFFRLVSLLSGSFSGRAPPAALAAAALFALHPVHVEVVSWHQGSKMTLMGLFFLLSLIFYIRFRHGDGERYYWLCLGSYIASLLSQPAAISLPLVLVAWEAICNRNSSGSGPGRSQTALWLRLVPFFLPALALAYHLLFVSTVRMSMESSAPLVDRVMFLPVVWGKSLLKLILPVNICARYPLVVATEPSIFVILYWIIFCAALGWAMVRLAPGRRGWFALLFFLITILPTSGLIETSTLLADRYLYLPGMGIFFAAGVGIQRMVERSEAAAPALRPTPVLLLSSLLLAGLAAIALVRQYDWRDRVSLWSRVVEVYPRHSLGQFNLADAWNDRGVTTKAIEHYRQVLEIDPGYGDAYANLSTLMLHQGRSGLARQLIGRAVDLRPDRAEVWIKRGIIMASTGDDSIAVVSFNRAIGIDDGWAWTGHLNIGMLHLGNGEYDSAREHLGRALELADARRIPEQSRAEIRRALRSIPQAEDRRKP